MQKLTHIFYSRNWQYAHEQVLFNIGKFCWFDPKQLTKVVQKPECAPKGKCQSLDNEIDLQLRRLDREQALIQQARGQLLHIQQVREQAKHSSVIVSRAGSCSPTSVAGRSLRPILSQNHPGFAGANYETIPVVTWSILKDSGAFTNTSQAPPKPVPPCRFPAPSQTIGSVPGSASFNILPPHNHQGLSAFRVLKFD